MPNFELETQEQSSKADRAKLAGKRVVSGLVTAGVIAFPVRTGISTVEINNLPMDEKPDTPSVTELIKNWGAIPTDTETEPNEPPDTKQSSMPAAETSYLDTLDPNTTTL